MEVGKKRGNEATLWPVEGQSTSMSILLANTHLLMVRLCFLLHVSMVLLVRVVINVWKTQELENDILFIPLFIQTLKAYKYYKSL